VGLVVVSACVVEVASGSVEVVVVAACVVEVVSGSVELVVVSACVVEVLVDVVTAVVEQPAVWLTSATTASLQAPPISSSATQKKAPP